MGATRQSPLPRPAGGARIAVLGPAHPFRGGIAHHTTLLAAALRVRNEVLFVSFRDQYPRWLFPGRTDRDPSAAQPSETAARWLSPLRPWTWSATAARIRAFAPHLLVVAWWVPFWAPSLGTVMRLARRNQDLRVAAICHNVVPHEGGGAIARKLTAYALRAADGFVVHSGPDERALRALLPEVTQRPGAVRRALLPAHTIASGVSRARARETLGLRADARVALFFGFVRPYKGLEQLIDAAAAAAKEIPDLALVVAGEFWLPVGDFERRARHAGLGDAVRIDDRYVPNEEVGPYFAAADVVVLPYLDATQSGVVTLASQFGVPVIATRVGGLPEAVLDGETGVIVEPGDVRGLAEALVRVLGDDALRARLQGGVQRHADRFAWEPLVVLLEGMAAEGAPARVLGPSRSRH